MAENGKSYRIVNADGKESNVSEAMVEVYKGKAKLDPEGWSKFKVLHEVNRKTGEEVVKSRGSGDRAAT